MDELHSILRFLEKSVQKVAVLLRTFIKSAKRAKSCCPFAIFFSKKINRKWIPLLSYSGLVHYFLPAYQFTYYVVPRGHLYFMHKSYPAAGCLQRVRLGVSFWG